MARMLRIEIPVCPMRADSLRLDNKNHSSCKMAIEIEKKYILDKKRLVELTAKLDEIGATFLYETFEENYLHRGGLIDGRGAVLRLRKTEARTTLTYKEKVGSESDFKQQIAFETEGSDVDATE